MSIAYFIVFEDQGRIRLPLTVVRRKIMQNLHCTPIILKKDRCIPGGGGCVDMYTFGGD